VFDATEAERLDRAVGQTSQPAGTPNDGSKGKEIDNDVYGDGYKRSSNADYVGDSGGPSRYFYTSKASKAERTEDGKIENAHPTVKPIDLMEWLVTLVTKENQIVLDPFTGSGTTCKAAKALNRQFIGIEQQAKWADVARVRCGLTPNDPSVVRDDEQQSGLETYE
jgi:site-specific DNA-methyltransferase (adenine-specific)